MSNERGQKQGEPTSGLTPAQIGALLGAAALAWMIADWLRWMS